MERPPGPSGGMWPPGPIPPYPGAPLAAPGGPPPPGWVPPPYPGGYPPPPYAYRPPGPPVPYAAPFPHPPHPGGYAPPYGAPPAVQPYGMPPPGPLGPVAAAAAAPHPAAAAPSNPDGAAPAGAAAAAADAQAAADDAEAAALEAEAAALEAEADRLEAEERAERIASAWMAHKAPDGRIFYHNSVSGESSWQRPADYRGGDGVVGGGLPVPVAQAPVGDTGWVEVKCADGRRYWFRGSETTWAEPPEVVDHKRRVDAEAAEQVRRMQQQADAQRAAAQRQLVGTMSALGAGVPPPQLAFPPGHPAHAEALRRAHLEQAMAARAAAGGDGGMQSAQEARVAQFKALLADAGVNGFSFWAKVRPKLEKDPRWNLIPTNRERQAVFEEFCKSVGTEQKAAKAAAAKAAAAAFSSLLEEFVSVEKRVASEMESAAAAAAEAQREDGEAAAAAAVRAPRSPGSIPEEELDGLSYEAVEEYWGKDARWGGLEEGRRRELFDARFGAAAAAAAERKEAAQRARVAAYREALASLGVDSRSRWTPLAEEMARHPAGAALADYGEREALFRAYVAELREKEEAEAAAEAAERRRQADNEARLAQQGEEAEKRRRRAAQGSAATAYRALLGELVKDHEARYREWRDRLQKDPQRRASNPALTPVEYEALFLEHTRGLEDAIIAAAKAALAPLLQPLLPPAIVAAAAAKASAPGGPLPGSAAPEWPRVAASSLALPLREFGALSVGQGATVLEGDARWTRASDQSRARAWREWVDEHVWGRPPVPPPPALGGAGASTDRDWRGGGGGGGVDGRLGRPEPGFRDRADRGPMGARDGGRYPVDRQQQNWPRDGRRAAASPPRRRPRSRSRSRQRSRDRRRSRSRSPHRSRDRSRGREERRERRRSPSRSRCRSRERRRHSRSPSSSSPGRSTSSSPSSSSQSRSPSKSPSRDSGGRRRRR